VASLSSFKFDSRLNLNDEALEICPKCVKGLFCHPYIERLTRKKRSLSWVPGIITVVSSASFNVLNSSALLTMLIDNRSVLVNCKRPNCAQ